MAAFVPGYETDLFISYAHDDEKRWVESFEEELSAEVSRRLGVPISIWQDTTQVRAGQNWQATIQEGIEHSAAFLAIVSPHYQNSRWCHRERNEFLRRFPADQPLSSGRFFKAVKTPWPGNTHRMFLHEIQDVDFFKSDGDSYVDFVPGSRDFKRGIRKLADGLESSLRRIRRGNQRVHVAWPAEDCQSAWEQLSSELRSKGFDVQPMGPRDASFAELLLLQDLDRAVLSVHLLGAVYEPFSKQMALLAADQGASIVFWTSKESESTTDPFQRSLIEVLRSGMRPDDPSRELPKGWSLIQDTGIRRLIDAVVTKLRPQSTTMPVEAAPGTPTIYIVHDATSDEDTSVAMEIKDEISRNENMQVFASRSDLSSPTELKLRHENLLRSCDGVLLYRNAAPEGWLMQLAPEVILAERRFDRRPLKSRAFLLSQPPPWDVGPDVKVIPYSAPLEFDRIEPFLQPLRR